MEGVVGIAPSRTSCSRLVTEELLHSSKELCGFAISELFSTDELLKFSLLRGGCASNEFGFEGVVGVLDLYWILTAATIGGGAAAAGSSS